MQDIPLTPLRNALADGLFSSQHSEKIDNLRIERRHSIQTAAHQVTGCNCFSFAFGLTDTRSRDLMGQAHIFADTRFISWLRATRQVTKIDQPHDQRCIALYFLDEQGVHCKHAAIRSPNGRLISKWGTYAVYEHGLEEVPSNYGDYVLFVAKPSAREAYGLFATYVKRCQSLPNWARPFGN